MRLDEIKNVKSVEKVQPEGTYGALRVLPKSALEIMDFWKKAGHPVSQKMKERRLHTTLIYSRKWHPEMVADKTVEYEASVSGYELFTTGSGNKVLVMVLNAPLIVARHLKLMADHGATYDHPNYIPHVTITDEFNKDDVAGLPIYDLPIMLGDEYIEPLDDD